MFIVDEACAAAIREAYEQRGELAAAVELRRRFPGIGDNQQARSMAIRIAGWPSDAELEERIAAVRKTAGRDATP
jgi:hypothetical protein